MDNELHDIDKLFFNSLEPNEEKPSKNVWADINKKLVEEGRKKLGGWRIWAKRSLFLLLFIGLGFGGYHFFHLKKSRSKFDKTATSKQNNLQLLPNMDTLKKENNNIKNNYSFKKTIITKADAYVDLNKDKINPTNKIIGLNNLNQTSIPSTKKVPLVNARNKFENTNNKKTLNITNQNFNDKAVIVLKNNKTLENISSNKKSKINFDTNKNGTKNAADYLSEVALNSNKKNSFENQNNNPNPNILDNGTRILNARTAPFEINNILILRSSPTINLHHVETGNLPLLNLAKDPTSKKTAGNKQILSTKSRFYISAFAAPEWQGYQLKDNDDQTNAGTQNRGEDTKNKIKHREDEDASLVAGIGIGYRLSKRLSIESGLRNNKYAIRTDSAKSYARFNTTSNTIGYKINTSLGFSYLNNAAGTTPSVGDSIIAHNLGQSVNYLSLPLLFRYETGKGRISFDPGLGFVFNFILHSSIHANIGNGQKQMINLQGLKKVSVGMMFTPAIYYRFSNRISFGLEPYFNYTISPINKATVVDSYPYGVGTGAVVKYYF